jgi:hypothetical protein
VAARLLVKAAACGPSVTVQKSSCYPSWHQPMKSISPIHFIDKLIKRNELGQPFRLSDHQREVLRLAFAFDQKEN